MATPLVAGATHSSGSMLDPPHKDSPNLSERIGNLEIEVSELKDTVARFAEVVLGEVKDLRNAQVETPPAPPAMMAELPLTAGSQNAVPVPEIGHEGSASTRRHWLLTELISDFGATFRMYFDPRYRVRRYTQIMFPLLGILFALNWFFFRTIFAIPILSSILEKLVDAVLVILLYKVLVREVYRYRQVLAQLMAWQEYRTRTTAIISGDPPTTQLETD